MEWFYINWRAILSKVTRGRKPKVSDERLLLELLLHQDRAAYSGEIAEKVEIGQESVRKRMAALADDGYVDITNLESHNVYRLTNAGFEHLAAELRSFYD